MPGEGAPGLGSCLLPLGACEELELTYYNLKR
jgi:hypothetical protein